MTIHVLLPPQDTGSTDAAPTAYDSVWAGEEAAPVAATQPQAAVAPQSSAMERAMLSDDKLYVVLAVVLLVWVGIAWLLLRTDRRLAALEEESDAS